MSEAGSYHIAVPEERLVEIRRQVRGFPWDEMPVLVEDGDPWSAGASRAFMREFCDYWVEGFDWRAQEAAINRFPQLLARLGDQQIHVLRERGSGPHDRALVLTHGWPGSIVEFQALSTALRIPSASAAAPTTASTSSCRPCRASASRAGPRCRSDRATSPGSGTICCAGSSATSATSRRAAIGARWSRRCAGSTMRSPRAAAAKPSISTSLPPPSPAARRTTRSAPFARAPSRSSATVAYSETHRTRPQTLAYATAGNAVGAAAWIIDKFHAWSDRRGPGGTERDIRDIFGIDTLVANVMFYVATQSFATATWIYRAAQHEVMRVLPAGTRIEVPTGYASFPRELRPLPPKRLIEKTYNLVRFTEFLRGGHFAALEVPDLFIGDVAAFIRQIRDGL